MSDAIKHECGVAMLRLKKPLQYYIDKYNTATYGLNKMYVLLTKQKNRGQDGAGIANIKLEMPPGTKYIHRVRNADEDPLNRIFAKVTKKVKKAREANPTQFENAKWLKENVPYVGEVWLGHLRYVTYGERNEESCHPFLRQNNWRSRNLVVAGNFNMTNADELFEKLVELGQRPKEKTDTVTVMEKIGHFLDEENQEIFNRYNGKLTNHDISYKIEKEIDLKRVLERSCKDFDGGYAMVGLTGYGGGFVARDPSGIRPAYYYEDDEIIVVASEKPAIKTAFNCDYSQIREVKPAHALIIDKDGQLTEEQFIEPLPKLSCSFERIYFSRGSDPDIYFERKKLGELLIPQVLKSINSDLKNTIFSYIPNTAESAFLGLKKGIDDYLINRRKEVLIDNKISVEDPEELLSFQPRIEKLVIKDVKARTFITDDANRDEMVSYTYDTTYEVVRKGIDNVVVVDDSIVRGTTLEKSILALLNRLEPKKIIVVSSAPQIRYPDCYGIDMSKMKDFVAFRAVLGLIEDKNMSSLLDEVYNKCIQSNKDIDVPNYVKEIYEPFSYQEISDKIAQIVRPKEMHDSIEIEVVYQTVENLHKACPNHRGDWYFTGNYPTPGGNKVVNRAFINFMNGEKGRAY